MSRKIPPYAPALAACASLKGMKSGGGIDRLAVAQTQLGDISTCTVAQMAERRDPAITNVCTTLLCVAGVLGQTVC